MRRGCARLAALVSTAAALGFGAPAQADDSICPDRPTKAFAPCTVPQGDVQIETGLVDGAFLRQGGVTTDSWIFAEPTFKYGLSDRLDVELDLPLWESQRTHDSRSGAVSHADGLGDASFAFKYALTGPDAPLSIAVRPFVSLPTGPRSLGASGVEGGLNAPVQYRLSDSWSAYVDPEVDLRRNSAGGGVHAETVQILGVTRALPANVSVSGELWGDWSFEGGGRLAQSSADLAVAWLARKTLQLDVGVNFGLNRATPGAELYAGVSSRF